MILEGFGVKTERSYDQSLRNFETFLTDRYRDGLTPVLLVDEAQNLNRDTLKLVHYLLNFETATTKLLQVILVGQEELAGRILRYPELASRMFPIAINAKSADELRKMISFRWLVAGGQQNPFPEADLQLYRVLFGYSKGLPRDAVKLCDEVLRDLAARDQRTASAEQVEAIARELNLTM
jgi:general secretion pathway protein A